MLGNFFNNASPSSEASAFMEPLNLSIGSQSSVKPSSNLPLSADQAVAFSLWNQIMLSQQQAQQRLPPPPPPPQASFLQQPAAAVNILQQLQAQQQAHQQQQQQQQQLLAFLTLKNHLEQLKSQMMLVRGDQHQQHPHHHHQIQNSSGVESLLGYQQNLQQSSPSAGFVDGDSNSAKLEPATPNFDSSIDDTATVPQQITKVAPAGSSKPKSSSSSRKRSRKFSHNDAVTTTPTGSSDRNGTDGATPNKSVCIGGYYDANNVYAKLVTVTDEARRKLASLPNIIGDYICALCTVKFDDAFCLAAHNCPKLEKTEHRCPECNKVFSCPANLASHRRWHRPKPDQTTSTISPSTSETTAAATSKPSSQTKQAAKRPAPSASNSSKSNAKRPSNFNAKINENIIVDNVAASSSSLLTASPDQTAQTVVKCPMCPALLPNRNDLRSHITSHLAAQLANFQPQTTSNFVGSLMAAAAAVN